MPCMKYGERRAGVCACLCFGIVMHETSDLFDRRLPCSVFVNRDRLAPPRKNVIIIPNFRHDKSSAKRDQNTTLLLI